LGGGWATKELDGSSSDGIVGEAGPDGGIGLGVVEVESLDPFCGVVGDDPPDGPLPGVVRRLFSEDCGDKVGCFIVIGGHLGPAGGAWWRFLPPGNPGIAA
jgi:hypothetical protein